MSQLSGTFESTRDVVHDAQRTVVTDGTAAAPVVITEQEVMYGTRAAMFSRAASAPHRFIDVIRVAAASLRLPPPRRRYPIDSGYLERSRMAREMDRL
jgi:hypothetical protein